MNYSLTSNTLKSEFARITLKPCNGHLKVRVKFDDRNYYRINCNVLTNVKSDLTSFESKVVLIHVYKLLDRFKTNPQGFRDELDNTNYAAVFGTPWL